MSFDPTVLEGWSYVSSRLSGEDEFMLRLLCMHAYSGGVADMLEKSVSRARQGAFDEAVREALSAKEQE